jgi:hypothetical protein
VAGRWSCAASAGPTRPAQAQAHADARAHEALNAIIAGQVLPRREVRSNYGVEGVPIREQIVQRDGDVIITRNSYGALCLNTPTCCSPTSTMRSHRLDA